jgi:adenylyltransferase/sulfurtransferase
MNDWFDLDLVRSAKVLVVGAGAIGNEVLKNLALLGVGNIVIFDKDIIEKSNLSRSILFRTSDQGQQKAETAAKAIRQINPDVRVEWQNGDIRVDLGLGLLRRMDVVIACLDNIAARYELNRDCWSVGRPWIEAGIGQLNGQVRVFRPGYGACYECSFNESDYEQAALPCARVASLYEREGKIPTTPTIASIVAGVQVQEALKLLAISQWDERTLVSRVFYFNGTKAEAEVLNLTRRADCPCHSPLNPDLIVELPWASAGGTTAAQLLRHAREKLGPMADIKLNFDLVVDMRCRECGALTRVLKPLFKLYRELLKCDKCGQPSDGLISDLVTTNYLGAIAPNYEENFLDCTLSDLGVPPLDILLGRGPYMKGCYFELTGDTLNALRFQKDPLTTK